MMSDKNRLTRRAAAILLATIFLFAAIDRGQAQSATVRLVIDYGDGVIKTITGLPWAKGSTVLDVMNAAKGRPHGILHLYRQRRLRLPYQNRRGGQRGRR
jgi:sulfate adenylyltransferase subunit 1 (EFTu-like GTPase family)